MNALGRECEGSVSQGLESSWRDKIVVQYVYSDGVGRKSLRHLMRGSWTERSLTALVRALRSSQRAHLAPM